MGNYKIINDGNKKRLFDKTLSAKYSSQGLIENRCLFYMYNIWIVVPC